MTTRSSLVSIKTLLLLITITFLTPLNGAQAADYLEHPKFLQLLKEMAQIKDEKKQPIYQQKELITAFADVNRQQHILDAISRPAEKTKTWAEYKGIFINDKQLKSGIAFWKKHKADFTQAEQDFQVPAEIILAIIGVETRYGTYKGRHSVLDALATLAFDYPPRSKFFYKELKAYLELCKQLDKDPREIKGSYAGAMGYPQFIPTSYQHYAIDFDGDGFRDLINNPKDAIGSVANYFVKHKWKPGAPVFMRATWTPNNSKNSAEALFNKSLKPNMNLAALKENGLTPQGSLTASEKVTPLAYKATSETEHWLGLHNFYVITRYNRSRLYARAVYELSQALKAQMELDPT